MRIIELKVNPVPAPRMTDSDRWKTPGNKNPNYRQRLCVTRYFEFKTKIQWWCKKYKYQLSPDLNVRFYIEMPKSWSDKKRRQNNMTHHQQKPDLDNLIKSFMDSFGIDDSFVHTIHAEKMWAYEGMIVICEFNDKTVGNNE